MSRISVIIPVYKVGRYIENSIKSVIAQTFKDFDVVLVDNNSPDESIAIAERLLAGSNIPFTTIKQQKQGLPAARNMGIQYATGEWLISIDPDDTISHRFLNDLYDCATSNNLDVIFSKYDEVGAKDLFVFPEEDRTNVIELYSRDEAMHHLLVRSLPLMVSNMFFRKDFFLKNNLKFDEDVILGADLLLLWRLLACVDQIAYINKYLYNHYLREDSLMTAPSEAKILSNIAGYKREKDFIATHYSEKFSNWVYSREVYALMNTMGQFADYSAFIKIYEKLYSKEVKENLSDFPDKKVRWLNKVLIPLPKAYFYFIKLSRGNKSLLRRIHRHFVK